MNHPFERSKCDCDQCKAACRHMPGTLAPGDFEQIAAHLGEEPNAEFAAKYFQASDGPLVAQHGKQFRIPTVVPALTPTGCVFLDAEGHCRIHAVAPFGCAVYRMCVNEPHDNDKSHFVLTEIIRQLQSSGPYRQTMESLLNADKIAPPLTDRRSALGLALYSLKDNL